MTADRIDGDGGFTVLDGAALVMGAAVAAIHVKGAVPDDGGPAAWAWISCLYSWVMLTATGPFLFLARRFGRRPGGYPRLGDRLWALAGTPWCVAALVRAGGGDAGETPGHLDTAYVGCLGIGLTLAMAWIVPRLALRYLLTPPSCSLNVEPVPWTDRLGLALTIAWPIQCGVGLVVIS